MIFANSMVLCQDLVQDSLILAVGRLCAAQIAIVNKLLKNGSGGWGPDLTTKISFAAQQARHLRGA